MLKRFGLVVGTMLVLGFAGMFASGCGGDEEEGGKGGTQESGGNIPTENGGGGAADVVTPPSGHQGTTDCKQIVFCDVKCTTEQCKKACLETATPEGRAAYTAIDLCEAGKCSQFSGKPFAGLECVIKNCGEAWTGCLGAWGTANCTQMIACMEGCAAGDFECWLECLISGSEKAQIAFSRILACLEEQCEWECAEDDGCDMECAEAECAPYFTACSEN